MSFELFRDELANLPKENRWVRMGDSLPWDKLERVYNRKLNNAHTGAGNKSARVVIGALLIKHKMRLSDVETIEAIRENPYMQYMLGFEKFTTGSAFDPSLFVTIRKRLGVDDINSFTELLMKDAKDTPKPDEDKDGNGHDNENKGESAHPTHGGTLKIDATCCDSEVKYPTDLDLLHDGCRILERVLDRFCHVSGIARPNTNWTSIHKTYSAVIKKKVKPKKQLARCTEYLIHMLSKNIGTALELIGSQTTDKFMSLRRSDVRVFLTTIAMLKQQKEMFRSGVHRIADRIVSIFQSHVRPIVRGKSKARVEFGAKIGASIVKGYTFVDHHSWDAYNESEDLMTHLRKYKARFGMLPRLVEADKIYLNKQNRRILRLLHIEVGGKPLGRPPKDSEPTNGLMAKYIGERNEIEAAFGTGKRVYGANNIRAKLPDTGASWAALCFFAKNAMKFLRDLLLWLFETASRAFDRSKLLNWLTPMSNPYGFAGRQIQ